MGQTPLVEMINIHKRFGGVHAVNGVSLDLYPGEVVGVLGHNGAGKTVLMKALSGAIPCDEGEIRINGETVQIESPRDARKYGIETIYQTLALADNLDAAANLFLGREIMTRYGTLNHRAMENEARYEGAKLIKRIENETNEQADKKAKKILATAIQRYAGDFVAERTVSVVQLPSDEMKGRIIGREGRNIRALEAATGIDLIIDDTPEAVILSGFNPVRREVARISLMRLISDGRIHPARIEDIVKKVGKEVDTAIKDAGEQAAFDLGVHGIHNELIKCVGKLKFRTSYAQNVLQHSVEVGFLSGIMASELGLNVKLARRMGLLHDIGKAVDHEVEGPHALIGSRLAKKFGESPQIVHAVAAHHEDVPPSSVYALLVQASDGLSGARPGARKELLENYIKRLEDLENIANSFKGVDNTYAIQAGRELRVIVESNKISDEESILLSRDVVKKIEESLTFPGQIKVTVIRETRAVEYANK